MPARPETHAAAGPVPGARGWLVALTTLALATPWLGGCRREPPREPVYDLASEAHLARQLQPGGVLSFVAPPATLYAVRPRARRAGVTPRLVSSAILQWSDARPRELVLDIEPPGWGSGEVELTLNRTPLPPLALGRERAFHTLSLPTQGQVPGVNRLRLIFPGETSGPPPPPAGPPARLHGVSVRSPGQPGPPRFLDVRTGPGDNTALTLAAGTGLEFALRLPEAAELRFTPRRGEEATGPVHFRVELTVEGEPTRELLAVALQPGDEHPEIHLGLPGSAGQPALLGLRVSGPGPGAVVGEWGTPRVLGRPAALPPGSPPGREELARLRRRVQRAPVLLLVLDAAAAAHFGCYGYDRDTTPEIDRIAGEGVVFERAYSPASYTSLAMASLWTSQHPEQHHHGVRLMGPLPEARVTLPEVLREQGVPATVFMGNLNAGELSGLGRGFTATGPLRLASKASAAAPRPSSVDRMVELLAEGSPGPRLIYAHYLEPHFPYDPPPPFDTRFGSEKALPANAHRDPSWVKAVSQGRRGATDEEIAHLRRLYDGNLAAVDHEIGLLRGRLEDAGCWNDLVVIVTADHGETFRQHGQLFHAGQVYEESVRIPLVIKLPGETPPARVHEPVDLIDLGATLADLLGVVPQTIGHFQGRSLLPRLAGEPLPPRAIVSRNALERPTYAWVDGTLKIVHDPRWGVTELYDLARDPGETRDLAATRPVTTEVLRQSLYRWLRDLDRGDPATVLEPDLTPEDEEALRALGYLD